MFSDLITSKIISISEKHGNLVASVKNLVVVATPTIAVSSSELY